LKQTRRLFPVSPLRGESKIAPQEADVILTIANIKGGVAKSTMAVCLATMAAAEGASVVIVDADDKGTATDWGNARSEDGVEPPINVVGVMRQCARTVAALAREYDLVVVDIGAGNKAVIRECAEISNLVLLPCGPMQPEIARTVQTLSLLHDVQVPTYVLLNRVALHPRAKETQFVRQQFRDAGVRVFDAVLPRRKVWEATGNGLAIHEISGADAAVAEMRAVYDEVVRRINHETEAA
jgi:chromosome partitioning protein